MYPVMMQKPRFEFKISDVSVLLSYVIITLINCSLFRVNILFHLIVLGLLLIVSFNKLPINKLWPIIILDLALGIMFFKAGQFGMGFFDPINNLVKFIYVFETYVLYLIIQQFERKTRKRLIEFAVWCLIVTMIISLYYNLFIDSTAIRFRPEQYTFICTFGQYYECVIVISIIVCTLFSQKNVNYIKSLLVIGILGLVFLVGNLVTGLVLAIGGIGMALILSKVKKLKYGLTFIGLLGVIALSLRSYIIEILLQISEWQFFNKITADKIIAMANLLSGRDQVDTLSTRSMLTQYSINSFKQNPWFGIGYEGYHIGTVGCHQEWSDMLAVFGIVGVVLIGIVFLFLIKQIYRNIHTQLDFICFSISLILIFILGFLNPALTEEALLAVLVIAPNSSLIFRKKEINE